MIKCPESPQAKSAMSKIINEVISNFVNLLSELYHVSRVNVQSPQTPFTLTLEER